MQRKSSRSKPVGTLIAGSFFYGGGTLQPAQLVFLDGTTFSAQAFGAVRPVATGEVVFHTGMSGYQEVLTDPSYYGQVVTFTYPHIGNYGVNKDDAESARVFASGVIVRDYVDTYSNGRADQSLDAWLKKQGVMGITGLDTRKLTRYLRDNGAQMAAFGTADTADLQSALIASGTIDDLDLVAEVTTDKSYSLGSGARTIVAYDFGIKKSILKNLSLLGRVVVVPASTTAAEVLELKPDGVFLSNGPGNPTAVQYAVDQIGELLGKVPIFGICLGHQLLCLALGAETHKLEFGHHGANHPVEDLTTHKVEITSQNHNYAVDARTLRGAEVTHVNLNDSVVEGIEVTGKRAFSVQYHPEAGPGPHDSLYLFERFARLMDEGTRK